LIVFTGKKVDIGHTYQARYQYEKENEPKCGKVQANAHPKIS
jgi:hypothetical protein